MVDVITVRLRWAIELRYDVKKEYRVKVVVRYDRVLEENCIIDDA